MNWTGGSLQRSKNANRGIIQKQKAHFARARTQLQNGPNSPLDPPFHPSFFQDENTRLGTRVLPFTSKTVRHTGHSKTLRNKLIEGALPPVVKERGRQVNAHAPVCSSREAITSPIRTSIGSRNRKREATDADSEEALLEVRRRRLLQQRDWAGLTQSNLAPMQFESREEKDKIGKRRKLKDPHARAMLRNTHPNIVHPHPPDTKWTGRHNTYMIGTLQNEDIRIQIGTAALSNLTPTQQTSTCSQEGTVSHGESSDTMLFDDEDSHTVQGEWLPDSQMNNLFVGGTTQACADSQQSMRGERVSNYPDRADEAGGTPTQLEEDPKHHHSSRKSSDGRGPSNKSWREDGSPRGCYITQRVGGVIRHLHLGFDKMPKFSTHVGTANTFEDHSAAGTSIRDPESANARTYETGNDKEHSDFARALARPSKIVDDGPWRPFLPFDDGSSHSSTRDTSSTDAQHHFQDWRRLRDRDADAAPWSQGATQGDPTYVDSSSRVSPSLPSITRDNDTNQDSSGKHKWDGRAGVVYKEDEENEKLWQKMVFGDSDAKVEVEDEEYGRHTPQHLVPPFVVARPLSSASFRSVSGLTSRESGSTRDIGQRGPILTSSGSMLPLVASSLSPGHATGGMQEGEGVRSAERSGFGDTSVTHSSLQNELSHSSSASSPGTFGERKAFHDGLDQRHGCAKHRFGPVQARRSENPSVYDIPASSDEGLDLVDGNRQ